MNAFSLYSFLHAKDPSLEFHDIIENLDFQSQYSSDLTLITAS